MFTVSRGIPVNDGAATDQPLLTRDDIWRGLVLKADNALPFVPKMTKCEVTHRAPTWLERDIVFRDEPASERVTFYPREEVRFERLSGATLGTIRNQIEESDDGALILRFTFSLEREGIEHGSAAEQAYAKEMEGAYLGAVDATLAAIRKFTTAETSGSPVEVASSPEIVGYLQRLLEVLDRQDLDTFASFFAANAGARIGNVERVVGQKRLMEGFKSYLEATRGPQHEIVDVWHVDRLIGAEMTMTSQRDHKPIAVPCVYLLRMDGDLIEDLRVFADVGPFSA
jgi:acetylaranotin biosynthesis cluster protein L/SnoaL-like protein